jgi:8-oxo-dGTP pyrophosphatase MutT (NUDIX family)
VPPPSLSIIALGDWPAGRLHAASVPSGLRLTPDHQAAIEREWSATTGQRGVDLFDGPLCRLEGLTVDESGLHLRVSPTSYRVFIGTNGRHPQWADAHGRQVMADPIGTSVVLRSSDGVLVFGRRSQRVALYPGFVHPFGGTMEPPADGAPPDPLAEMRRELAEEIGILDGDLDDLRIIGVIEDRRLRQPELIYAARTVLPAAAISARLDLHEHSACWLLPDEQERIEAVLTGADALTPVLAGTLLAWGWRRFGDAWLDGHLACCHAERQPVARWG